MIRTHILAAAALAFASSSAFAADAVFVTDVAPAAASTFNWTGFYAGISGGIATGDATISNPFGPGSQDLSASGFIGGVQVGYDWQMDNNFVIGAVADISASNIDADIFGVEVGSLKYLGTVRARAGYAWDRALVYAHGGLAYGKIELNDEFIFQGLSNTHTGWTIGAGIEYALTDKVTFGTEYAYVDLGKKTYADAFELGAKAHTVKATLNYRF